MSSSGADHTEAPVAAFGEDVRPALPGLAERPMKEKLVKGFRARLAALDPKRREPERPTFNLEAPLKSLFAPPKEALLSALSGDAAAASLGESGHDHPGDHPDENGHSFSLSYFLRHSAVQIERSKALLGERARAIASAIEHRRDGEASLIAYGFRLVIAVIWGVVGMQLELAALAVEAGRPVAGFFGAIPPVHAHVLSGVFLLLAGAGVISVLIGGWIVMATGGGDNRRLRSIAARFGDEAADVAKRFDAALDALRARMDRRERKPADAVEDLSRAHLTALEAAVFFQDIQFLTDPDTDNAAAKFRGYLRAHAGGYFGGDIVKVAAMTLLGLMIGYAFAFVRYAPKAPAAAPTALDSIALYPWALGLILGLALLYALMGRVIDSFRGSMTAGAAIAAREEALDALRSAFVAGSAPRIEDVVRRIEDAVAVFRARLGGHGSPGGHDSHHAGGARPDEPAWRRSPEAPRFVEQTFLATPKTFRADPQPAPPAPHGGLFGRASRSEAAPKQGFSSQERPPWLKD